MSRFSFPLLFHPQLRDPIQRFKKEAALLPGLWTSFPFSRPLPRRLSCPLSPRLRFARVGPCVRVSVWPCLIHPSDKKGGPANSADWTRMVLPSLFPSFSMRREAQSRFLSDCHERRSAERNDRPSPVPSHLILAASNAMLFFRSFGFSSANKSARL